MILNNNQSELIRKIVSYIYTHELNQNAFIELTPYICELLGIHYFAASFLPNKYAPERFLTSNNPEEFNRLYTSLIDQDFLMDELVKKHKIVIYKNLTRDLSLKSNEFDNETQKLRPVSDGCYLPLKINGELLGFYAIARAGGKSKDLSAKDIEIFNFVCDIITDRFKQNLYICPETADIAYMNSFGEISFMGSRIKDTFIELFGVRHFERPLFGNSHNSTILNSYFRQFEKCDENTKTGEIAFCYRGKKVIFHFNKLTDTVIRPYAYKEPQYKITLHKDSDDPLRSSLIDYSHIQKSYHLTPKEIEIISFIYKGLTNRQIASCLAISESTVKHHVWNIFNKTGVDNRTQLIFTVTS